jgi:S-adenosylmethionine hydrolase
MATKRKTTRKKASKKATASSKEKAAKLDSLQYSSGKIDDETLSKIEELEAKLGVHEVNHFGTNDSKIFEKNLKEMTLSDLQSLCGKVRLFASGNTRELKQKLRKEFTRVTKGNKTIVLQNHDSVCDPSHPNHEKAKKILGQGF